MKVAFQRDISNKHLGLDKRPVSIVFFICDRMLSTSVALPMEQLRAAESIWKSRLGRKREDRNAQALNIQLLSAGSEPVQTQAGLTLNANGHINAVENADIVYLPALWRNPLPVMHRNSDVLPWLNTIYSQGAIIAGVSTGCFLMAEAGLLDNRAATTHWHYFDQFQQRYPSVVLKREHFITEADGLYCTGSVNALADLTIHFIENIFSKSIAHDVERHFFHEIRHDYGGTSHFKQRLHGHPDESIIQIQNWLRENHAAQFSMSELATKYGMSLRTLNRRFKAATGQSPKLYLQGCRMNNAKDLLQSTDLSVTEISDCIGYTDSAYFSSLFRRFHGVSPSQYRMTVRAKIFSL